MPVCTLDVGHEGDAPVADVAGQALQLDAVHARGQVLEHAGAVADAVGPGDDGGAHGLQARALAGVDGHRREVVPQQRERGGVLVRGVALLRARQVERHDVIVVGIVRQVVHEQLRHLDGTIPVAHGRQDQAGRDVMAGLGGRLLALPQALDDGVHDFLHGQAAVHVELRGDPQLGVDHAVPGEILHGLAGDAGQRLRGLRDGRGVGERLEVRGQAARVSGLHEPAGDLLGITGGQGIVTRPIGELDESGGTHPAGQMIVEDHLRQISNDTRLDLLGIEGHLG